MTGDTRREQHYVGIRDNRLGNIDKVDDLPEAFHACPHVEIDKSPGDIGEIQM